MARHAGSSPSPIPEAAGGVGLPPVGPGGDGDLLLRTANPQDGEAIHRLVADGIAGACRDRGRWLRRWHWQCWSNPFRRDRPVGWVLENEDGAVVGHVGAVYLPWRLGRDRLTGMVATDFVVAESALKRGGVFAGLHLAQAFFDASDGLVPMATTANEKTVAVFARFGCRSVEWTREFWRASTRLSQRIRTCRGGGSRVARRLLRGSLGGVVAGGLARLYGVARCRPSPPVPKGCTIEVVSAGLAWELSDLSESCSAGPGTGRDGEPAILFGIDLCPAYLDWRYARHPERDRIRVAVVRDADRQLVGGAVISVEDRGARPTARVDDVVVRSDRPEAFRTLLCAALGEAADLGADDLVTMTGRQTLRPIYWELGFEGRSRGAPAATFRLGPAVPATPTGEPWPPTRFELWHGAMF